MTRPAVEVADILRAQGNAFWIGIDRASAFSSSKLFGPSCAAAPRLSAVISMPAHAAAIRTISYNSCRNRHCPKCQAQARERWLAARERELLDTSYFHVVFTVPHELNVLALENPREFYDLLFRASARNLAGDRSRSETSGRRDRLLRHPAHLGTEPAAASPHSLCHSRRRALAGPPSTGSTRAILSSCPSKSSAVSFAASSSLA